MTTYLLIAGGKAAEVSIPKGAPSAYYGQVEKAFWAAANTKEFIRWVRLPAEQAAGIPFTWELAGSAGATFNLIALPDTTKEQIDAAKAKLRAQRDVVSMRVIRVSTMIPFTP
jgi:hypothetical protein